MSSPELGAFAEALALRHAVWESLLAFVLSRAVGGDADALRALHAEYVQHLGQLPVEIELAESATVMMQHQVDGIFSQASRFIAAAKR